MNADDILYLKLNPIYILNINYKSPSSLLI